MSAGPGSRAKLIVASVPEIIAEAEEAEKLETYAFKEKPIRP
jgi:hypothetical protein